MSSCSALDLKRMQAQRRFALFPLAFGLVVIATSTCFAMISVGTLTKETAKDKYGITMHARQNGDAGIQVWLEFQKKGWLEKFTYAQLEMIDGNGKKLISAMLQTHPVHHRQATDVTTVAFSADASQLPNCRFLIVCYNSSEGDVGYYLNVKDFLDMNDPITD